MTALMSGQPLYKVKRLEAHMTVSMEMCVGLNPYPTKILDYDTTGVTGIVVKL